ncbi:MAG: hypothetical protein LBP28_02875 [Coriobacteriales bacterium]|nr:hypothetical protein [Coriobacteriales bacterium]
MTMRKLAVYLTVAFALAWVLQAAAVFSTPLLPSAPGQTSDALAPPLLFQGLAAASMPALAHGALNACAGIPLLVMPAQTRYYLIGPTLAGPLALLPALLVAAVVLLRGRPVENDRQNQAQTAAADAPNPQAPVRNPAPSSPQRTQKG